MLRPIVRHGAAVLHRPAEPVAEITPEIDALVDDMIQTMYAAPGIGLAAPQVGVGKRVFVCDISVGRNPSDLLIFINPEFLERDGMQLEEEGCLSVPGSRDRRARSSRD
jgi:peptide deformylase